MDIVVIFFATSVVGYVFYHLLKSWKQQKLFSHELQNMAVHTSDLNVYSVIYSYNFLNFGSTIQWVKFHFKGDETFISLGSSFFKKSYSKPFVIKSNEIELYPIFSKFEVRDFVISANDLKIKLKTPSFIGPSYKLYIKDISTEDLKRIKSNLY